MSDGSRDCSTANPAESGYNYPVASLEIRSEEVWVRLTRAERIWALQGDVAVPYPSILSVGACAKDDVDRGWFRIGTNWPGRYYAGRYRNRHEPWALWLVGNPDRVLVMSLRDHHFGQIVLELDDPDASAAELRQML